MIIFAVFAEVPSSSLDSAGYELCFFSSVYFLLVEASEVHGFLDQHSMLEFGRISSTMNPACIKSSWSISGVKPL